jgi:hypothetical protein
MKTITLFPFGKKLSTNFFDMNKSRQQVKMLLFCNTLFFLLFVNSSMQSQSAPTLSKVDLQNLNGQNYLSADNEDISSLINATHPSIYVYNGTISGEVNRPVAVFTDAGSLNSIYAISNRGTIETITIQIKSNSDLPKLGFLNDLKKFPRIKVIKLNFEFEINPQDFSSLIPYHEDFSWVVVYEIVKPS